MVTVSGTTGMGPPIRIREDSGSKLTPTTGRRTSYFVG